MNHGAEQSRKEKSYLLTKNSHLGCSRNKKLILLTHKYFRGLLKQLVGYFLTDWV